MQTLTGPIVGAAVYGTLQVFLSAWTDYWRLVIGVVVIALVVAFHAASSATRRNALRRCRAARQGGCVTLLAVRGLRKAFGGVNAVAGIDLI